MRSCRRFLACRMLPGLQRVKLASLLFCVCLWMTVLFWIEVVVGLNHKVDRHSGEISLVLFDFIHY